MAIEVKVPTVGESIKEVVISKWLKADGSQVKMDEAICEIESDKATVEIPAPQAGVLKTMAKEGDTVLIGSVVASIEPGVGATTAAAPAASAPAAKVESEVASANTEKNFPSPAAAKILDEKGISAASVNGSGKDGRITKSDALSATSAAKPTLKSVESPKEEHISAGDRGVRTEKMSSLRKTIAKRLVAVKNLTAMLTTFNEVDMSAVMDLRKKYKDAFKEKHEISLGFMSFFTKAVCLALKEFPAVNAQIDGENILFHDYADVGVAVSTPKGLMVPVIRNAEQLSLAGIEKRIAALALKARDGKLGIDEMQGGTFTITNGGVFGSMLSTPILNAPQSAILGMHNIVERPVAINGQVVIRPIMYLALSYDHRIIDGRESVSFLKKVKEYLEDPSRLLLDV